MSGLRLAVAMLALLAGCDKGKEPIFQGWVEAELIFVGPDEAGRIETLSVREGDHVERGALLFTVDPDLQLADVAMQEAAVKNAQTGYDRAQQLARTQAGTQKSLDDAEAALRTAQARHNSAQTRLTRRKVFSPVSGSVQQIYYRGGELCRQASRSLRCCLPATSRCASSSTKRCCPSSSSATPSPSLATAVKPASSPGSASFPAPPNSPRR